MNFAPFSLVVLDIVFVAVDGLGLNGIVGFFDLGALFLRRVTGSQSSPSGERTEPLHGEESPWGDRTLSFLAGVYSGEVSSTFRLTPDFGVDCCWSLIWLLLFGGVEFVLLAFWVGQGLRVPLRFPQFVSWFARRRICTGIVQFLPLFLL